MIRRVVLIAVLTSLAVGGMSPSSGATLEIREARYYGTFFGSPPLAGTYGPNLCNQPSSAQGVCFSGFSSAVKSAVIEIDDDFVAPNNAYVVTYNTVNGKRGQWVCSGYVMDMVNVTWVEVWVNLLGPQSCGYGAPNYANGVATKGVVRLHLTDDPVPVWGGGGGW